MLDPKQRAVLLGKATALLSHRRSGTVAALLLLSGGCYTYYLHRLSARQKSRLRKLSEKVDGGPKKSGGKKGKSRDALNKLLKYLLPIAGQRILLLLGLAIVRTAFSNRLARMQGYMFRAAFLRKVPLFIRNFGENVVLCLLAAGVESTANRFLEQLKLKWRSILTERVHKQYFNQMTYYKMSYVDRRVDNPEQRICEDIPKLCNGLGDLVGEWTKCAVDAVFYSWVLRSYTRTNKYTAIIIAYVFGAGAMTVSVSPNFSKLFKTQASNEGTYRQLHARLRTNAEPVAFYGGVEKEGGLIVSNFKQLVKHQLKLLNTQWLFAMWQDFHTKYLAATMAVVLIIGPFFAGHLRPSETTQGRASMLANMRYHTAVIISLFTACGTLASSSRKLMRLGAHAERILELEDTAREINSGKDARDQSSQGRIVAVEDEIAFEDAMVVTPADATLVKDLTLRVPSGTNLLVTGPNGSGKSSLFRVLGGLWPLTAGTVKKPGGPEGGLAHEIFYVPQRPYVTMGTLQDQLIYPVERSASQSDVISAKELRRLLSEVDLEYLVEREGGLDAVVDWGSQLSLGEQQRLGMARLFYHRPKFAILDECTSGVTVDMEERFCQKVKQLGCTCVTISHRPALMAFHDIVLALDGEGGWSLHRGARGLHSEEGHSEQPAGAPLDASNNVKARGADASECLEGLQTQGPSKAAAAGGRIIARAPPFDPARDLAICPPNLALQPRRLSTWQRWKTVIRELLGHNRGAISQLSTILVVVSLRSLLQDRMAALNGRTVEYVLKQDKQAFIRLIHLSIAQAAASAVLAPSLRHVADSLSLSWRRQLTAVAHKRYLKRINFYTVSQLAGMQDVDQRLTRDVERLCDDLAALIPSMVKPVVDLAWFSVQLYQLTGRRGMAILYLYAFLGFGALSAVTPDFGALAKNEYFLEGAFRNVHTRLRTHAESIAFFGGGVREGKSIAVIFDNLISHLRSVVDIRWLYSVADDFFTKQLPHNVTWGLTVLYALDASKDLNNLGVQGQLVNDMRYLASVVTQCFTSFGELLALNKRFAELTGGVTRVSEMLEVMEKADRLHVDQPMRRSMGEASTSDDSSIRFNEVDVVTPTGKLLARRLSLIIEQGHSVLVTGPNGSGKSSLFRILGGLWPMTSGSIHRPGGTSADPRIFYVPQKPYTTIGTLREQVIYPLTIEAAAARESAADSAARMQALDSRLDGLMLVVRLQYLVAREGGWGAQAEWGETLSLGEQQRMGMARLFFHNPKFGVLDECTNATSVDIEEHLYRHAAKLNITLVTITQRAALLKYHSVELRLVDGEGDWQLRAIVPEDS
ncbi:g5077 [Coccomyxa viridis]|uniref:G5077 protein n=1 Tax=Coccomyxa viridis TaxID=1274662 RepID=A0ABP1FYS7_9CHLO